MNDNPLVDNRLTKSSSIKSINFNDRLLKIDIMI